jgi:MFS family permease
MSQPASGAHRADGLWSPDRRQLTLGLVLTITLVASESLAISAAMPVVAGDLGGHELYGWVFSAFFLGSLVGITVVGGLIDERGLVVPFVAGLVLFGTGLLVGGLAPSMPVLVAARLIQGLGGGATPPIAYVAIGRALPEHLRPRMFANLSTAWVLPGVFGPGIAGFVAQAFHWRLVFLGLLPLLLVAGTIAVRALAAAEKAHPPDHEPGSGEVAQHRRRLVLALGVALGGGLLTAGLQSSEPALFAALVAAGLAIAVLSFRPLTPPGTLRLARGYPAAILLRGLLTFAFFTIDPYVTLLLVDARGWPAAAAGLGLTGATVAWTLGSWFQARRSARTAPDVFVRIGFPLVGFGIAGFGLGVLPAVPALASVAAFALAGFGMGVAYAQFAIIVLRDAPKETHGSATAAVSLADMFGTALGTGATNALIAASLRSGAGVAAGTATGIGIAVAVSVGAALLGFILSPRLRGRPVAVGVPAAVR